MATSKRRATVQITFSLTMELPHDVTVQQAQTYVKTAVAGWAQASASKADEPMLNLDRDEIRVALNKKVVTYA